MLSVQVLRAVLFSSWSHSSQVHIFTAWQEWGRQNTHPIQPGLQFSKLNLKNSQPVWELLRELSVSFCQWLQNILFLCPVTLLSDSYPKPVPPWFGSSPSCHSTPSWPSFSLIAELPKKRTALPWEKRRGFGMSGLLCLKTEWGKSKKCSLLVS